MKMCEASKESELHGRMRFARYSFKRGLCVCMYTNAKEEKKCKCRKKKKEAERKSQRWLENCWWQDPEKYLRGWMFRV